MTGLIIELGIHLNHTLDTRERLMKSRAQKVHDEGITVTVNYLRQQATARDIGAMLEDERFMLTHSLKFDANSPEEKSSLQAAIDQLDECRQCFEALSAAPEAYKQNVATYSSKKKEAGLPLDAARDFFKSHSTRLTNILSGKSAHHEKILVRQRKDNLQVIRDAYVELQRKALGANNT